MHVPSGKRHRSPSFRSTGRRRGQPKTPRVDGQAQRPDGAHAVETREADGLALEPLGGARVHFGGQPDRKRRPARGVPTAIEEIGGPPDLEAPRRRSRRLRVETVALGAGAAFVVLALLKPWGASGPITTNRPQPQSTSEIAVATFAPSAPSSAPVASAGPVLGIAPDFATVDWTQLLLGDNHRDWGIATARLDTIPPFAPGQPPIEPEIVWLAAQPQSARAIHQGAGSSGSVFAIAVSWPGDIHPQAVTFQYLGTGRSNGSKPGGVFFGGPFLPIPVSLSGIQDALPVTNGIPSGTYWLPPVPHVPSATDGPGAETGPLGSARRTFAAPWPKGGYRIVVELATGQTIPLELVLD